jgi:hypothetical protein
MSGRKSRILFPIRGNGRLGFIDARGEVVITPRFQNDRLAPVHHEFPVDFGDWVPVKTPEGWGYLDDAGEFAIPPRFALACPFSEDRAAVSGEVVERSYGVPQGRWGYIDRAGNVVIPCRYGSAEQFQGGLGIVSHPDAEGRVSNFTGRYGLIDRHGTDVVPGIYEVLYPWQEGLALAAAGTGARAFGFLDARGSVAIPFQFSNAGHFNEGFARVERMGRLGLLDRNGTVAFGSASPVGSEALYRACARLICTVSEGLVLDVKGGKCGYRDTSGAVVIDYAYDDALSFSEGRAGVKVGRKWGFVDRAGRQAVVPQFEEVGSFHEGLAQVKVKLRTGGKSVVRCGFVDPQGRMIIEPRFTKPDERELAFRHGLAAVILDKRRAYVDRKGSVVWSE